MKQLNALAKPLRMRLFCASVKRPAVAFEPPAPTLWRFCGEDRPDAESSPPPFSLVSSPVWMCNWRTCAPFLQYG